MEKMNVLFILSDEHNREITGCYGNPIIKTPHIDSLAARGVIFDNAYCNSPICVPSRASLATGAYVHRIRYWDNAIAYDGRIPSWHHRLREAGHDVVSIGKLHFRSGDDDNGFSEVIHPIYIVDGEGDTLGLLRKDMPVRRAARKLAEDAGRGLSSYTNFDIKVADTTAAWLRDRKQRRCDKPWVLFSSLLSPHFPLIAPGEFYDLYASTELPRPRFYDEADRPSHPVIAEYGRKWNYDDFFDAERLQAALAAYYGLCSFLDFQVGRILAALDESGFADNTLVIYTSDHGDNLGNRGLWGKSLMYEESCAIPMVVAGGGVAAGQRCHTPVSLVDVYPTIVESVGETLTAHDRALPGDNLIELIRERPAGRVVFSEYHAAGSMTGQFMLRQDKWKLVCHVGYPSQLFDLSADPFEANDLAGRPEVAHIESRLYDELEKIVDPDAVNRLAFADQQARIDRLGGADGILSRAEFGFTPAPS